MRWRGSRRVPFGGGATEGGAVWLGDDGMTHERSSPGEAAWQCVRVRIGHVAVLCAIALCALGHATGAAGRAEAGELSVAIHVSSDGNRCYDPGLVAAIRHFTSRYAEQVNASGGIHGLSLKPIIFDDFESADRTG